MRETAKAGVRRGNPFREMQAGLPEWPGQRTSVRVFGETQLEGWVEA